MSHCLSNTKKGFQFPWITIYHVTYSFLSGIQTFKNPSRRRERGGPVPPGTTKVAQGLKRHSLRDPETQTFPPSVRDSPHSGSPPSPTRPPAPQASGGERTQQRQVPWEEARAQELMSPQAAGPLGRGGVRAATGDGWLGRIRGRGTGRPQNVPRTEIFNPVHLRTHVSAPD